MLGSLPFCLRSIWIVHRCCSIWIVHRHTILLAAPRARFAQKIDTSWQYQELITQANRFFCSRKVYKLLSQPLASRYGTLYLRCACMGWVIRKRPKEVQVKFNSNTTRRGDFVRSRHPHGRTFCQPSIPDAVHYSTPIPPSLATKASPPDGVSAPLSRGPKRARECVCLPSPGPTEAINTPP